MRFMDDLTVLDIRPGCAVALPLKKATEVRQVCPTHVGGAPFQLVEEMLGSEPIMSLDSLIEGRRDEDSVLNEQLDHLAGSDCPIEIEATYLMEGYAIEDWYQSESNLKKDATAPTLQSRDSEECCHHENDESFSSSIMGYEIPA